MFLPLLLWGEGVEFLDGFADLKLLKLLFFLKGDPILEPCSF